MLRLLGLVGVLNAFLIGASVDVTGAAELKSTLLAQQVLGATAAAYPDLPVSNASCPREIKRKAGVITQCDVDAGGLSLEMRVTQTDPNGNVTIESTQALIPKGKAEAFVVANSTVAPQVDCGPDPYIVRIPGAPFLCTARFADGTVQQVVLSVVDVAGNVTITQVL